MSAGARPWVRRPVWARSKLYWMSSRRGRRRAPSFWGRATWRTLGASILRGWSALDALDAAVGVRSPGADEALARAEVGDGGPKRAGAELRAVIRRDLAQLPARLGDLARDAVQQLAGMASARVALGGAQLGPGEGGGHVDGGVLPDGALGAGEAPDVEAVELDLLTGLGGIDVTLGRRRVGAALVGIAVAGDQRETLGTRVQANADQD